MIILQTQFVRLSSQTLWAAKLRSPNFMTIFRSPENQTKKNYIDIFTFTVRALMIFRSKTLIF